MQSLDEIGLKHKTDKASHGHNYLHFYEKFLSPLRPQPITLVEAGVGGYEHPDKGGESLRMWREYFDNEHAYIVGFDVHPKTKVMIEGVEILQISQIDEPLLKCEFEVDNLENMIDVFIDDASHVNPMSIRTFEIMFPLVKPGGIYIWEDIHTSLWAGEYQGYPAPGVPGTALHYISQLMYGLQADTLCETYRGEWAGHIESIHSMRNTCVIIKRK